MADEKQLQDNQSQVSDILAKLRAQSGARGATYAGRVLTEKDTPQSVMSRLPGGDTEEYGTMALPLAGAAAGITKAQLKTGMRPTTQIAQLAKAGEVPITPIHQLWPAAINESTGEVAHAMQAGIPGAHDSLLRSIKNSVRGWVDPVTWKAYTDKMLAGIGF